MASIFKAMRAYRAAGAAACAVGVAAVLLVPKGAPAQQQADHVDVYQAPSISGTAQVGSTLSGQGGAWLGPPGTQARYQWYRCPTPSSYNGCRQVADNTSRYGVSSSDQNQYIFLVLLAWNDESRESDFAASQPAGPVIAPQPTPTATPSPPPVVATPVPTPVPNLGAVLNASAKNRQILRPFPVVRMRGRLTSRGARVTVFSVRGPRHARISVSCKGKGCPKQRWARTAERRLTRIGAFERNLVHGTRITVVVSRRGYVSKRTTFWIRLGKPPLRLDSCLSGAGRRITCPAGAR